MVDGDTWGLLWPAHTRVLTSHMCAFEGPVCREQEYKGGKLALGSRTDSLGLRPFPKDNVQPGSEAPSSLLPQPSLWGAGEWEVTLANLLCYQPLALGVRLPVWQLLVSPG